MVDELNQENKETAAPTQPVVSGNFGTAPSEPSIFDQEELPLSKQIVTGLGIGVGSAIATAVVLAITFSAGPGAIGLAFYVFPLALMSIGGFVTALVTSLVDIIKAIRLHRHQNLINVSVFLFSALICIVFVVTVLAYLNPFYSRSSNTKKYCEELSSSSDYKESKTFHSYSCPELNKG